VLAKGTWRVKSGHVLTHHINEFSRCEDFSNIRVLCASFIKGIHVVVLLSANRAPFINSSENIIKDLTSVDLDQATITLISDTTTVISLSKQELNSLPVDLVSLFVVTDETGICNTTKIGRNSVFADRVVRVIEGVADIPTESLELFALNQDRMEPTKTEDSLTEVSLFVDEFKCLALIGVKSQHVGFDATRRFLCNLQRSLQQTDREIGMG